MQIFLVIEVINPSNTVSAFLDKCFNPRILKTSSLENFWEPLIIIREVFQPIISILVKPTNEKSQPLYLLMCQSLVVISVLNQMLLQVLCIP